MTYGRRTLGPFRRFTHFVEGRDEVEESCGSTLSNTVVPAVLESGEESSDDSLDVGKEGILDGGEDFADRVGGTFLFDGESGRGVEHRFVVVILSIVDILKLFVVISASVDSGREIFRIRDRCLHGQPEYSARGRVTYKQEEQSRQSRFA